MTREPTEMEMRVAKALYANGSGKRGFDTVGVRPWDKANHVVRDQHLIEARAAIRAMRFATTEMLQAGFKEYGVGLPDAWLAMIDAASPE